MIALLALAVAGGSVVEAERDLAAMAQGKGQWTALRATAAPDALMFIPKKFAAQAWLTGRADPVRAIEWRPINVMTSCDGSFGLSFGDWRGPDGEQGRFARIWKRQPDNGWRWVLDHRIILRATLDFPTRPVIETASCANIEAVQSSAVVPGRDPTLPEPGAPDLFKGTWLRALQYQGGRSNDGTLGWETRYNEAGDTLTFIMFAWNGETQDYVPVIGVVP